MAPAERRPQEPMSWRAQRESVSTRRGGGTKFLIREAAPGHKAVHYLHPMCEPRRTGGRARKGCSGGQDLQDSPVAAHSSWSTRKHLCRRCPQKFRKHRIITGGMLISSITPKRAHKGTSRCRTSPATGSAATTLKLNGVREQLS